MLFVAEKYDLEFEEGANDALVVLVEDTKSGPIYTAMIYLSAVLSLIGFPLFDAGEPAVQESAAIMVAFLPFIFLVAVSATHFVIERAF